MVKRYGAFEALRAIDLEVQRGEIFALLGPNGAGKSTLIHRITGLARSSEGTIEMLPSPWNAIRRLNPILYMVNGLRHGLLGTADVDVAASAAWVLGLALVLVVIAWIVLARGTRLRD